MSEFHTIDGDSVVAVTAEEMSDVDRVAVEDVGLKLLQMMENAGRTLAWHVRDISSAGPVVVVAGTGGNGGGGMACARHLVNRGRDVSLLLDRAPEELRGAAAQQYGILDQMGVPVATSTDAIAEREPAVVVDALIGYGLTGAVRPPAREYIEWMNTHPSPVVSLDIPSGRDATTGDIHGIAVAPDRTVTLALPKTGLESADSGLFLADIAIPTVVYERLSIPYTNPFPDRDWIQLSNGSRS